MKIAEYKIIDYEISYIEHEATEEAEAYTEEIKKPVYGTVYRAATEEEIAQAEALAEQEQEQLPSAEERLEALENAMLEMMLGGAE